MAKKKMGLERQKMTINVAFEFFKILVDRNARNWKSPVGGKREKRKTIRIEIRLCT